MRFTNAAATTCLAVALVATPLCGVLVPGLDLDALCRDAGLIIVGRAMRVKDVGPATRSGRGVAVHGRVKVAGVEVVTTIKGEAPQNGLAITFFLPDSFLGYHGIPPGQFGIFFLKRTTSGFEPANPYYPFVVATPGVSQAPGNALDRVIAQLGHAAIDLRADEQTRRQAVMTLEFVRTPSATLALRRATADPIQDVRLRAIAASLRRNDTTQLPAAEDILARDNSSADEYSLSLINGLANAIRVGVNDQRSIPLLARLLKSGNAITRRAAVVAIRRAKGGTATGPLSEALADSDDEVVWNAIAGLAEITGNLDHGPGTLKQFRGKQKEQYVNYWRNWAKSKKQRPG